MHCSQKLTNLFLSLSLVLVLALQANAQIAHRYSFTADANDSVGTAHGTIVDAGTTPNFAFTGGQLDLSANTGQGSNAITEDAYVDLPNGIISAAAGAGSDTFSNGAVAMEFWATVSETHTWQRLGDFGTSNDGEDTSNSGEFSDYVLIAANSGRFGDGIEMTTHPSTNSGEPGVGLLGPLANNTQVHVFAVYNHNDPRGGGIGREDGSNGTMSLYVNGALITDGRNGISDDMDLTTMNDNNNWLGRSQWPDPVFDGSYNEFRVYDTAPDDAYVLNSFNAGPDSLATFIPWPAPAADIVLVVNTDTGEMSIVNEAAGGSIDMVGYSLTSNSGSLVPANWNSVAGNLDSNGDQSFDPDDSWSIDTGNGAPAPTILAEFEGIGDGGQLGDGGTTASIQIGNPGAFVNSFYADLQLTVDSLLPDFSIETIAAEIRYVDGNGDPAVLPIRSDLDLDGDVDDDDYILFTDNHLGVFTGMTAPVTSLLGDLDGDLDNDFLDFRIFEADYDAANGLGALQALIASVPEPTTFLLLTLGCVPWVLRRHRTAVVRGSLLLLTVVLLTAGDDAHAQLRHRYSFTTNANDSISGANGTVVDAGTVANFAFTGGQLDLSANNGEGSNSIVEDAYVDLPNGIVSAAASAGSDQYSGGAVAFEYWFTVATTRTWQRIGDFGTSNGGENTSPSGENTQYLLHSPNAGNFTDGIAMSNHVVGNEPFVGQAGPTPTGVQQHVVAVYNHNDPISLNGGMTLYINGTEIGQNVIDPALDLNTFVNNNNWLGRSQWPDPVFDGSYNEFRIYDTAPDPQYVADSFAAGPDATPTFIPWVPEFDLTMVVNQSTGNMTIKNTGTENVSFDYYLASSDGPDTLDPANWNSLDDQNVDAGLPADFNGSGTVDGVDLGIFESSYGVNDGGDATGDGETSGADFLLFQQQFGESPGPGNGWVEAGQASATSFAETFLSGATTLAPGEELDLGSAYNQSVDGDIFFQYSTPGAAALTIGGVEYVSSALASTVPEPTCGMLLLTALCCGVCTRRSRTD